MASIFNYNTLLVDLQKETRTVTVTLNRPEAENSFSSEMIFELETLFSWVASHMEINSVLLKSSTDFFSTGWDRRELSKMTDEKIQRLMDRLQKIIYSMFFLPQTVLIDMGTGARGIAAEFSVGADLRFARENAVVQFDHLRKGLIPACGGIGFLGAIVPPAMARKWTMTSLPLSENDMTSTGFISELYRETEIIERYLEAISEQAPIARIQAKRSMLDTILPQIEKARESEKDYALAGMSMGDWRKAVWAERDDLKPEFTSAKELSSALKKERENQMSH
ncbi:MAG: enoyl-CoA hydratase/isomerase family protein [Bacteriovoracaceae bacterium]|nr:enoyl-CoA hydratase/isomerase family protein [Bacteriovoracaceae bacterium]